jgi:hypothetical protein
MLPGKCKLQRQEPPRFNWRFLAYSLELRNDWLPQARFTDKNGGTHVLALVRGRHRWWLAV